MIAAERGLSVYRRGSFFEPNDALFVAVELPFDALETLGRFIETTVYLIEAVVDPLVCIVKAPAHVTPQVGHACADLGKPATIRPHCQHQRNDDE